MFEYNERTRHFVGESRTTAAFTLYKRPLSSSSSASMICPKNIISFIAFFCCSLSQWNRLINSEGGKWGSKKNLFVSSLSKWKVCL